MDHTTLRIGSFVLVVAELCAIFATVAHICLLSLIFVALSTPLGAACEQGVVKGFLRDCTGVRDAFILGLLYVIVALLGIVGSACALADMKKQYLIGIGLIALFAISLLYSICVIMSFNYLWSVPGFSRYFSRMWILMCLAIVLKVVAFALVFNKRNMTRRKREEEECNFLDPELCGRGYNATTDGTPTGALALHSSASGCMYGYGNDYTTALYGALNGQPGLATPNQPSTFPSSPAYQSSGYGLGYGTRFNSQHVPAASSPPYSSVSFSYQAGPALAAAPPYLRNYS